MLTPVPRSRHRRLVWPLAGTLVALPALVLAFAATERGRIARGVHIAGVDVGGMTDGRARSALAEEVDRLRNRPIRLVVAGTVVVTSGRALGARARIDEAVRRARREVGVVDRVQARLGFGKTRSIPLTFALDGDQVTALVSRLERRAGRAPRDARLVVADAGTQIVPALWGRSVDVPRLVGSLGTLPGTVAVPTTEIAPLVSTAEALRARDRVDRLLSQPRRVARGARVVTLSVETLRRLLDVSTAEERIEVTLDAEALARRLRPAFRRLERPPRDASFRTEGTRVAIVPSQYGRVLDGEAIARSLVTDLRSTRHRARLRVREPQQIAEDLRWLRIRVLVSEFTTPYPCCAPRVTNIKRAAAILDGAIIRARERFSLNVALGKRTAESGFVPAPQIYDGRLEDAVGGGVSQVATTLYNAAFFAGLRLDAHTPHQFYISRYPMGREATVSWGGPELVFTNDWPAAILVKVEARKTSITVRFYSSKLGRRVETTTGEPHDYVQPTTRVVHSDTLPAGARRVVQEAGPPGFTVEYTRKVYQGRKLRRDERFRVRYDPENEIVEVGPPRTRQRPPTPGGKTPRGSKAPVRVMPDR